jgi:hypothetical protein
LLITYIYSGQDNQPVANSGMEAGQGNQSLKGSQLVLNNQSVQDNEAGQDKMSSQDNYNSNLQAYHKEAFYKAFGPYCGHASKSSKLITDQKYSEIARIISKPKAKKKNTCILKYHKLYSMTGNVQHRCLYRQNKVVTSYEQVFDVILEAHTKISHARSAKSNLHCITNNLGYYGVPIKAMETQLLPQCIPNRALPKKSKQQSLKIILLKCAAARFHMDLIVMPEYNGHIYILRVVDRLTKFGYVRPVKQRLAYEAGEALLCILSSSILPRILHSNNGDEVRIQPCLVFVHLWYSTM